jgi:hypothetical protein
MPYLNWRDAPVQSEVIHSEDGVARLKLRVPADLRSALLNLLKETFREGAGELRLDLPRNWAFFWKLRDEESRILIAHPQQDEWVATFALEPAHAIAFLERFDQLTVSQSILLSSLGPCGPISNTDLTLELV